MQAPTSGGRSPTGYEHATCRQHARPFVEGSFHEPPANPRRRQALRLYLRRRDRHPRAALTEAVFISVHGHRWDHSAFNRTFHTLLERPGIRPRSANCRPRPHDLRHSFAIRMLLDWYRSGVDVPVVRRKNSLSPLRLSPHPGGAVAASTPIGRTSGILSCWCRRCGA
jgi:hypothetical protein